MTIETGKPKRRRLVRWIVVLAIIFGLTSTIAFYIQKRSLVEQSTLTATIHDWWIDTEQTVPGTVLYYWLSDHQILFARLGGHDGLYCYDTHTQKEIFLKSISRVIVKSHVPTCLDSLRVSPDGTRLLWGTNDSETVHGAWVDGSHYFTCVPHRNDGSGSETKVRWTSDSRRWVAFFEDQPGLTHTQAMIYGGDVPHKAKTVAPAASNHPINGVLDLMSFSTQSFVLYDHILAGEYFSDRPAIPAKIVDIGLGIPDTRLKTRSIFLGPDTNIQEMVFSPQGDQIAMLSTTERMPSWEPLLHRLLPHILLKPQRVETLWVDRVDGTQIHEIGNRNMERKEDDFDPQLSQLKWMPDGTRISYIYKSGIYTVAAK